MTRKKKLIIGGSILGLGVITFLVLKNRSSAGKTPSLPTYNLPVASGGSGGNSTSIPANQTLPVNTVAMTPTGFIYLQPDGKLVDLSEGTMIRNGVGKEVYMIQKFQKVYQHQIPAGRSMSEVKAVPASVFTAIPGTRLSGISYKMQ